MRMKKIQGTMETELRFGNDYIMEKARTRR